MSWAHHSVLFLGAPAQRNLFSSPRSLSNRVTGGGSHVRRRSGAPCPSGPESGPGDAATSAEELDLLNPVGTDAVGEWNAGSDRVSHWHPNRNQNTWKRFMGPEGTPQRPLERLPRPWYQILEQIERLKVEALWMAGHQQVSSQQLLDLANLWVTERESNLVRMVYSSEEIRIGPMWVALHQGGDGVADMYAPILPVVDSEYGKILLSKTEPVATVRGGTFTGCHVEFESWRNYFIGLAGDLGAVPELSMWPNWVFCNDRVAFNLATFAQLADFLADATEERIQCHLGNLRNLQVYRGYREQWCWYALRKRWGEQALKKHRIEL